MATSSVPVTVGVNVQAEPKPGYLTTEFWSTLFLHLLTTLATILTLTGHTFHDTTLQPLVPMAAFLASGIAQALYSHSRASLKSVGTSVAAAAAAALSQSYTSTTQTNFAYGKPSDAAEPPATGVASNLPQSPPGAPPSPDVPASR